MKNRIHPFTTLGALLFITGSAAIFLLPEAAPVLIAFAYWGAMVEFVKYTSRFQFGLMTLAGALLGLLLDLQGTGFPVMTLILTAAVLATTLRQAKMQVFTYVNHTWMEPTLMIIAIGLYVMNALRPGIGWQSVVLPVPSLLFAIGLTVLYVQDGRLLRRQAKGGYRIHPGH
ncbi:MAG: hypothetical protein WAT41_08575, partial [Flavobacteriales bacterium]